VCVCDGLGRVSVSCSRLGFYFWMGALMCHLFCLHLSVYRLVQGRARRQRLGSVGVCVWFASATPAYICESKVCVSGGLVGVRQLKCPPRPKEWKSESRPHQRERQGSTHARSVLCLQARRQKAKKTGVCLACVCAPAGEYLAYHRALLFAPGGREWCVCVCV